MARSKTPQTPATTPPPELAGSAPVFDRVRTLLQSEVSDYQMYPGRSEPSDFIAGPIFNTQGRIIGFVALELGNNSPVIIESIITTIAGEVALDNTWLGH